MPTVPGWTSRKCRSLEESPLKTSTLVTCPETEMGDNPNPETEDAHSSSTEDCEPMRMASLRFCRLRPNQFEKEQAWLEED